MADLPFEWRGRIPPDALSMDDFEVTGPSGEKYCPHEGETVWCRAYGATMTQSLGTVGVARDAFNAALRDGDNDAVARAGTAIAEMICAKVVHWDLTDPETLAPYPQPSAGPQVVFDTLPSALLLWLFQRLAGIEAPSDRGKGSSGSPDSSSTKRAPRRLSRPK